MQKVPAFRRLVAGLGMSERYNYVQATGPLSIAQNYPRYIHFRKDSQDMNICNFRPQVCCAS